MLASARKGEFNFMNRLKNAVEATGAKLRFRPLDAKRGRLSLWHMTAPDDVDNALIFRRTYHYPFWHIEVDPERWRWPVALTPYTPAPNSEAAAKLGARLRRNIWQDVPTRSGDSVLIALQGVIRRCRSFQTMTPVEMVESVGQSGLKGIITLHPREVYDADDHAALAAVIAHYPNLRMANPGEDSRALLPDCLGVVTMNSAVAFDGYMISKPAVLFGQIDFHHIALNVADLGAAAALAALPTHRPDFDAYLHWFLGHAIDAMAPDAEDQITRALTRCGAFDAGSIAAGA